jgi:hypothetical protein
MMSSEEKMGSKYIQLLWQATQMSIRSCAARYGGDGSGFIINCSTLPISIGSHAGTALVITSNMQSYAILARTALHDPCMHTITCRKRRLVSHAMDSCLKGFTKGDAFMACTFNSWSSSSSYEGPSADKAQSANCGMWVGGCDYGHDKSERLKT